MRSHRLPLAQVFQVNIGALGVMEFNCSRWRNRDLMNQKCQNNMEIIKIIEK